MNLGSPEPGPVTVGSGPAMCRFAPRAEAPHRCRKASLLVPGPAGAIAELDYSERTSHFPNTSFSARRERRGGMTAIDQCRLWQANPADSGCPEWQPTPAIASFAAPGETPRQSVDDGLGLTGRLGAFMVERFHAPLGDWTAAVSLLRRRPTPTGWWSGSNCPSTPGTSRRQRLGRWATVAGRTSWSPGFTVSPR
jgi:hypothetical protein